jgi:hypothetical protein
MVFLPNFGLARLAMWGGFAYIESIAFQPSGLTFLGH